MFRTILCILMMIVNLGCKEKQNTSKFNFKDKLANSQDSDSDGLNDLEESLMKTNKLAADLPKLNLVLNSETKLQFNFLNNKYELVPFRASLKSNQFSKALIYRKAIAAIYNHFYVPDRENTPPKLSDLYTLEVGCIEPKDQIILNNLTNYKLDTITFETNGSIDLLDFPGVTNIQSLSFDMAMSQIDRNYQLDFIGEAQNYFDLNYKKQFSLSLPTKQGFQSAEINIEPGSPLASSCIYLKLREIKYLQNKKKQLFSQIITQVENNNMTFIYIGEQEQWTISIPAAGTLDSFLKLYVPRLGSSLQDTIFLPFTSQLPQLNTNDNKFWYLLTPNNLTLNEELQSGIYILAYLSHSDFMQFAHPKLEIKRNLELSEKSTLNNFHKGDLLFMTGELYSRYELPQSEEQLISGVKYKNCARTSGRFDFGNCEGAWKKAKKSCRQIMSPQSPELENWVWDSSTHLDHNLSINFGNSHLKLRPYFAHAGQFYYHHQIEGHDLRHDNLHMQLQKHYLANDQSTALFNYVLNFQKVDVSKKRVCDKERKWSEVRQATKLKKIKLNIFQRRW